MLNVSNVKCVSCNTEFKIQDAHEVKEVRFKDDQRTENKYLACPNCGEAEIKLEIKD